MKTLTLATLLLAAALLPAQEPEAPKTPWDLVRTTHDKDGNGEVSAEEYTRGKTRFARLDKNQDGKLTEADFASGARGQRRGRRRGDPRRMKRAMMGRLLELTAGETMERADFDAWAKRRDGDASGGLDVDELGDAIPARLRRRVMRLLDGDDDGEVSMKELGAVYDELDTNQDGKLAASELTSGRRGGRPGLRPVDEAPRAGSVAPDFTLPYKTGDRTETLSTYKGRKPVALIFGSYT